MIPAQVKDRQFFSNVLELYIIYWQHINKVIVSYFLLSSSFPNGAATGAVRRMCATVETKYSYCYFDSEPADICVACDSHLCNGASPYMTSAVLISMLIMIITILYIASYYMLN